MVASNKVDGPVRDGRIVEVRHPDGSPPFLVQWTDSGRQVLVFPGPDARVLSQEYDVTEAKAPAQVPHIRSWHVQVDLFEGEDETSAHAVLVTEAPTHLDARGTTRRKSGDRNVPEIADEIAVARALRRLSELLLGTAADDISAIEGHPVSLPS